MAKFSSTGTVNVDWLNLRESPGGKVLTVLKGGDEVTVSGRQMGWLDVSAKGFLGTVFSKYITLHPVIPPPPAITETENKSQQKNTISSDNFVRQGEVTTSRLNLRSGPNGHILSTLPLGTLVTIVSESKGWMEIEDQQRKGFVSSRYIRPSKIRRPPAPKPVEDQPVGKKPYMEDKWDYDPEGNRFAKKYGKGVFSRGDTTISQFINANQNTIDSISLSQLRLLEAVSDNEGKLEAINTWDNAFLSFGIFQWTAGVRNDAGELPALLDLLQKRFPDVYKTHFGDVGLEVSGVRQVSGGPARGYFRLNDQILINAEQKTALRSLIWPYRFKKAGKNEQVRLVQLEHAVNRISCFIKRDNLKIREHYIGDYVTSEYGVALLLDQHVNRPAHVLRTLNSAVESLADTINVDAPQNWGDAEEQQLIDSYLVFRAQTSMTDSNLRAERIQKQLQKGIISNKRNSYLA